MRHGVAFSLYGVSHLVTELVPLLYIVPPKCRPRTFSGRKPGIVGLRRSANPDSGGYVSCFSPITNEKCRASRFARPARHHFRLHAVLHPAGGGCGRPGNDFGLPEMRQADGCPISSSRGRWRRRCQKPSRQSAASVERERIPAHRDYRLHQSAQYPIAPLAAPLANPERAAPGIGQGTARCGVGSRKPVASAPCPPSGRTRPAASR